MDRARSPRVTVVPATPERWRDVEALFGRNGACGGCWCQFWKQTQAEYRAGKGEPNRRALRRQVEAGVVPGLLAYAGGEPIGWVAVEPRAAYARLGTARNLIAVDDAPVWSAPCFFVRRGWRRRGLVRRLLEAAAARARRAGAPFLEGYPVDSKAALGDAFVYTGVYSTFARLGYTEVARRAPTRPVMRIALLPGVVASSTRPRSTQVAGKARRGRGKGAGGTGKGASRGKRR